MRNIKIKLAEPLICNSIFVFLLGLYCVNVFAEPELPQDVQAFIEKRDGCDHFRGEEPYNEERRKFIEENLNKLCTGTDKELSGLKVKYVNNPPVLNKLSTYEIDIEPD